MSHLSETIDEDKDIMIDYIHEDAGQKRIYIVHKTSRHQRSGTDKERNQPWVCWQKDLIQEQMWQFQMKHWMYLYTLGH